MSQLSSAQGSFLLYSPFTLSSHDHICSEETCEKYKILRQMNGVSQLSFSSAHSALDLLPPLNIFLP